MKLVLEDTKFEYNSHREYEEDNVKIWHEVLVNGKGPDVEVATNFPYFLDHSPYEAMDKDTFHLYCVFFLEFERFPSREDLNSCGPNHSKELREWILGETTS